MELRVLNCHGLVFLVTSPHCEATQESTKSPLIRAKDAPIIQESPRDLGALSLRFFYHPHFSGNSKALRALCQELRAETKYMFLIKSQPPE